VRATSAGAAGILLVSAPAKRNAEVNSRLDGMFQLVDWFGWWVLR